MRSKRCSSRGFTLIELMIAVAIVGLLAAVAYPSYVTHVRRSNRTQAQQALMDVASREQQYLLDRRVYGATLTDIGATIPNAVQSNYTITVAATNAAGAAPTFTATATPLGAQVNDSCGTLTLTHAGVKSPATCW